MLCSRILWFISVFSVLSPISTVLGVPASTEQFKMWQPDGSRTPDIILHGNENSHWYADEHGYTVIEDEHGWFVYAELDGETGDLVSSGAHAGMVDPSSLGIPKELVPPKQTAGDDFEEHRRELQWGKGVTNDHSLTCDGTGTVENPCIVKNLVVLVRFADHTTKDLPPKSTYETLFNNEGPSPGILPVGSVRDFWLDNSEGVFTFDSVVTDWIEISLNMNEAVGNESGLGRESQRAWTEALLKLEEEGFDFSEVDNDGDGVIDSISFLHSGIGAETSGGGSCEIPFQTNYTHYIWSHMTRYPLYWTGSIKSDRYQVSPAVSGTCPPGGAGQRWSPVNIGVLTHELGHVIGLPDLYDTEGGTGGVGFHDVMGQMWGWYGTGAMPPNLSAWSKQYMGWADITTLTESTQTIEIEPACNRNHIFRIDHNLKANEYFLIENRYYCGFDADLWHHSGDSTKHRGGVAIWHVDETDLSNINFGSEGVCANGLCEKHYRVALVQGDGTFDLERGKNNGDRYDLFKIGMALKIDNAGVEHTGGNSLAEPNTRGYAGGVEYDTGIGIEVLSYQADPTGVIQVKVDLVEKPGSPTPFPTPLPTVAPVPAPTPVVATISTDRTNYIASDEILISWENPYEKAHQDHHMGIYSVTDTGEATMFWMRFTCGSVAHTCGGSEHNIPFGTDVHKLTQSDEWTAWDTYATAPLPTGTYVMRLMGEGGEVVAESEPFVMNTLGGFDGNFVATCNNSINTRVPYKDYRDGINKRKRCAGMLKKPYFCNELNKNGVFNWEVCQNECPVQSGC